MIVITSNSFPFVRLKWMDLCSFCSKLRIFCCICISDLVFGFRELIKNNSDKFDISYINEWGWYIWFANRMIVIVCTYKTLVTTKRKKIINTLFHLTFCMDGCVYVCACMYDCSLSLSLNTSVKRTHTKYTHFVWMHEIMQYLVWFIVFDEWICPHTNTR